MKWFHLIIPCAVIFAGCGHKESQPNPKAPVAVRRGASNSTLTYSEARKSFHTNLIRRESDDDPVPEPPAQILRIVRFDAQPGKLPAYLTPDPHDGKKHPAIIWIFGGFGNGIGETAWKEAPEEDDQSARAFRENGIVTMYPSLRGGHEKLGFKEVCLGEVDDVLAAATFLAHQDFVDPRRIYLGGHSTGGTLVLLTAASSDRFRSVFSFGPVHSVAGYGVENLPFDVSNQKELEMRAPVVWLQSIQCPVFIFEGTEQGNMESLKVMSRVSTNPFVHFHLMPGANHWSILAPVTKLIAQKILHDDGPTCNITFSEKELSR
jgi:dipeptidyl aminopeptidase/acylaminoacyl peptidase